MKRGARERKRKQRDEQENSLVTHGKTFFLFSMKINSNECKTRGYHSLLLPQRPAYTFWINATFTSCVEFIICVIYIPNWNALGKKKKMFFLKFEIAFLIFRY